MGNSQRNKQSHSKISPIKLRDLYALVPCQSLSTHNINFDIMLNYNIAKRIQEGDYIRQYPK